MAKLAGSRCHASLAVQIDSASGASDAFGPVGVTISPLSWPEKFRYLVLITVSIAEPGFSSDGQELVSNVDPSYPTTKFVPTRAPPIAPVNPIVAACAVSAVAKTITGTAKIRKAFLIRNVSINGSSLVRLAAADRTTELSAHAEHCNLNAD